MKSKTIIFILFLVNLKIVAQITQGEYRIDTVLQSSFPQDSSFCTELSMNSVLIPYITGMRLYFKADKISSGTNHIYYTVDGADTNKYVLTITDTLPFTVVYGDGIASRYTFYFQKKDTIHFTILSRGTPQISNEPYYCDIDLNTVIVFDGCQKNCELTTSTPTKSCSTLTDINKIYKTNECKIDIFPSPVIDHMSIKTNFSIYNLSILNISGNDLPIKILKQESQFIEIDFSQISVGLYLIQCSDNLGNVLTRKFIKQE